MATRTGRALAARPIAFYVHPNPRAKNLAKARNGRLRRKERSGCSNPGVDAVTSVPQQVLALHGDSDVLPAARPVQALSRRTPTSCAYPGPIPAKDFWSVVVYDLWTRSMLADGRAFPSLNSYAPDIAKEADRSVEV